MAGTSPFSDLPHTRGIYPLPSKGRDYLPLQDLQGQDSSKVMLTPLGICVLIVNHRIEDWSQASPRIHSYRNHKFNYLSQKCDLLEQFDNGMKVIGAWNDMDDLQ